MIEVNNLHFDIKTRNLLHKSASWLLKTTIESRLESMLKYDLREQTETLRHSLEQWLSGFEPVDGIKINGTLESLEPEEIYITQSHLVTFLKIKTQIKIESKGDTLTK